MVKTVVGRQRTAWGAVLGGWLAALGLAALLTPPVSALLVSLYPNERSIAAAVPVLVGVGLAYLVGGHVAGRMVGYRTSWHGLLVAFFGLFVVLAIVVVAVALELGVFGATYAIPELLPALVTAGLYHSVDALAFGGLLGMPLAIFSAWLGGLLAPIRALVSDPVGRTEPLAAAEPARRVETARVVTRPVERRPFRLLPSVGRKGGERVTSGERIEPE